MPFDEILDARIRKATASWESRSTRRMFGGVCFLLRGTMVAGVWKEFLILRLGEEAADFARELPHVRPFDITGRPMKGWVMVEPAGCRTDSQLKTWLEQARAFAKTLPQK
jgi:TfoX/Sxy family transcriptional regulator of competence genes